MGSNSVDVEKYGHWSKSEPLKDVDESQIKITKLIWKSVNMVKDSTRIGIHIGRGILDAITLGVVEAGFRGQTFTHDLIEAITNKGPDYTLEYLGSSSSSSSSSEDGNCLRCGKYETYIPFVGVYEFEPKNMYLSDLRKIKNDNPGYGNCKDHAKVWWKKIKEKYSN